MTPQEFKTIRQQLGLTQAELAPLLGFSDAMSVSRLETGARPITFQVAQLMRCYEEMHKEYLMPKFEPAFASRSAE